MLTLKVPGTPHPPGQSQRARAEEREWRAVAMLHGGPRGWVAAAAEAVATAAAAAEAVAAAGCAGWHLLAGGCCEARPCVLREEGLPDLGCLRCGCLQLTEASLLPAHMRLSVTDSVRLVMQRNFSGTDERRGKYAWTHRDDICCILQSRTQLGPGYGNPARIRGKIFAISQ